SSRRGHFSAHVQVPRSVPEACAPRRNTLAQRRVGSPLARVRTGTPGPAALLGLPMDETPSRGATQKPRIVASPGGVVTPRLRNPPHRLGDAGRVWAEPTSFSSSSPRQGLASVPAGPTRGETP